MTTKRLISLPVLALAALFCIPHAASAQTVLLSADDFSVLGGTGITVSGSGYTFTNGDIGLSPGATAGITGFPPATISGNTRSGSAAGIISTGSVTQQARADLMKAQAALNAMQSTANLSNRDLASVGSLTSGVYTFSAAATLNGTLTLDANFQNNVAWVFNIATTFDAAVNSSVKIINFGSNGGNDLGLFWNSGTAMTFADNNTILGNYMSATGIAFNGGTNTKGNGGSRALALTAVTFAGPGTMNALGSPSGHDWDSGLTYNSSGQLAANGDVLLSSSGVYTQGGSSVVLVPGTRYQTQSVTIDGSSRDGAAGPASLTIDNSTITLTGLQNTYTGGTIVNNGTLITSSANLPVSQSIALNKGNLTFNQTSSGTFGGAVTGDGSLTKIGAGTLTLTAANSYTGTTTVSAGNLQIGVNGSGKTGTGAVSINGSTAILSGTGTVQGSTTVTQGLIQPGDSAGAGTGRLTFSNNLTYTGGSTQLKISGALNNDTNRDFLHVIGALTLSSGSNINVLFNSFTPVSGTAYTWYLLDWSSLNPGTFSAGTNGRTGGLGGGNLDLPDITTTGSTWNVSQFLTNGSISIMLVPEPSRAPLLMAGLAFSLMRRRRSAI